MRSKLKRRPSGAMIIALVALFVALGGTAVAKVLITGASVKNHSLTGTDVKNGSIKGANVANNTLTGKQIKESSLGTVPSANNANNANNAGNASKLGGKGAGSFQPTNKWALIAGSAAGANVLASSGGFSVTRSGTGQYVVDTGVSTANRPLSATISLSGGVGQVYVAPCGGTANNPGGINCPVFNDNNHVFVETANGSASAVADRTFYLVIGG
jgi:hypothetical protein